MQTSGVRRSRLTAGLTVAAGALVAFTSASAAFAQAPPNDNRAAAELTSGGNVTLLRDNDDSTTQGGELLTCSDPSVGGTSPFDSTVWFSYDPPAAGTAVFNVAGGVQFTGDADGGEDGDDGLLDTVVWVYNSDGSPSACDDDSGNGFQSQVSAFYGAQNPAPVLVQVGGFDFGPATFFEHGLFTYTVNFSPATRVAASRLKGKYERFRKFTLLKRAQISVESGTTTLVKCRGGGCKRATRTFTTSPVSLKGLFRGRRAPKGAVLDVFVTEPQRFGFYLQVRFRGAKSPLQKTRCLAAGDTQPTKADITQCPA